LHEELLGLCCPIDIRGIKLRRARWAEHAACIGKGKAIPLQAWTGPEGSRRLRLPDFKTIGA
jgi:hypothetical protein